MSAAYFLSRSAPGLMYTTPMGWIQHEQGQFLQSWSMSPALPKSPRAERNQHSNREHLCIALRLGGGLVEEGADTGILFVDKVPRAGFMSAKFQTSARPLHSPLTPGLLLRYVTPRATTCIPPPLRPQLSASTLVARLGEFLWS